MSCARAALRARRLLALAAALGLAGCAGQPSPESSLPERVIRNAPVRGAPATPPASVDRALPAPSLHDDLPPPAPTDYADLLDRLRAGYRLPDVRDPTVEKEFDWYVRHETYLQRVLGRGQRYLHHITTELEARGMPAELALLPVVESAYNPFAVSRSRAVGLWQFIAPTGERFGLKSNDWQDQRRDVIESTRAALDYLEFLRDAFAGDWLLAIAAYNNGRLNVQRSMQRNRERGLGTDFFSLDLPAETRAYVPKLLALSRLVLNPAIYGVKLPRIANAPYFTVLETGGPLSLQTAAVLAGVDLAEMQALNPAWHRGITGPDGPHRLLVPVAVADRFSAALAALPPEDRARGADAATRPAEVAATVAVSRVDTERRHIVQQGDTLWSLARRYDVPVAGLARANGLSPRSHLSVGAALAVPPPGAAAPAPDDAAPAPTRKVRYTVRRGDTLAAISRRFAVTVADLRDWNGLRGDALQPGQRLVIHVDARRDYGG
jgi:membrane-bound lytic murein transglycosylase D